MDNKRFEDCPVLAERVSSSRAAMMSNIPQPALSRRIRAQEALRIAVPHLLSLDFCVDWTAPLSEGLGPLPTKPRIANVLDIAPRLAVQRLAGPNDRHRAGAASAACSLEPYVRIQHGRRPAQARPGRPGGAWRCAPKLEAETVPPRVKAARRSPSHHSTKKETV